MKRIIILLLSGIVGVILLFVLSNRIMADKPQRVIQSTKTDTIQFQDGDIIFQISKSSQSKAIQLATNSKYSHMGILYSTNGEFNVYEAIQPVKLTPLKDWIKRGLDSHYVVKRLQNNKEILTNENVQKMKDLGETFTGKNYDLYFEWSDDRIYCSELVWKIYKEALDVEIGDLQKLSDFDLTNSIVKNKLAERYGSKIPLSEKVISPAAMFNSDKLLTVYTN